LAVSDKNFDRPARLLFRRGLVQPIEVRLARFAKRFLRVVFALQVFRSGARSLHRLLRVSTGDDVIGVICDLVPGPERLQRIH
jgi:hypothetical protein